MSVSQLGYSPIYGDNLHLEIFEERRYIKLDTKIIRQLLDSWYDSLLSARDY